MSGFHKACNNESVYVIHHGMFANDFTKFDTIILDVKVPFTLDSIIELAVCPVQEKHLAVVYISTNRLL